MPEYTSVQDAEEIESEMTVQDQARASSQTTGSFIRHVILFSASNLLYLLLASATTFFVPKWLSIDDFATYRYFLLFGGFAGALHLGSVDGALMSWVRNPEAELSRGWMPLVEFLLVLHLVAICLGTLAVTVFLQAGTQTIWFLILILLPVANGLALSQYALQAVRRFSILSSLTVFTPVCTLAAVIGLHVLHKATGVTVILAYLLSNGLSAAIGLLSLWGNVSWRPVPIGKALRLGRQYLIVGWSVLIFNLLANFMTSADRFFVVAGFSTKDFAEYSFAGAIFYSIFLVMLSVSKVVFPYLADGATLSRNIPYARVRDGLLILWALSLGFYFPIAAVIYRALPRYSASIPIVRLLLLATAGVMLIQILHANYFRLLGKQRSMTVAAIAGAAVTLASLFLVARLHSLPAIASTTVAGCTFWCLLGELMLRRLMAASLISVVRTFAGLGLFMAIFLYASQPNRTLLSGFVLQITFTSAASILVFFPTIQSVNRVVRTRLRKGK